MFLQKPFVYRITRINYTALILIIAIFISQQWLLTKILNELEDTIPYTIGTSIAFSYFSNVLPLIILF